MDEKPRLETLDDFREAIGVLAKANIELNAKVELLTRLVDAIAPPRPPEAPLSVN